jgi:hypothetical protein
VVEGKKDSIMVGKPWLSFPKKSSMLVEGATQLDGGLYYARVIVQEA